MLAAARPLVALLVLVAWVILAPSLVAHEHSGVSLLPHLACAQCALINGAAPAAERAELAVSPLDASEPAHALFEARVFSTQRTTAVPRGPPTASL